jgi:glycosyltransferase involved in cell wall biosynthesis
VNISVLIPVKGDAVYLEQALMSIEKSNFLPNETLIIDDGIDQSVINKIRNDFKSINLKIIKNSGVGLVDALNTGIKASVNEYLARFDSDDLMDENRLKVQYEFLEKHSDVTVVGSQVTYIDHSNKELGKSAYPNGDLNLKSDFLKKCLLAHPSVMIRKTHLLKVNGYRETVRFGKVSLCEDFDLWRRLINEGRIVNLPEYLTRYRQHSTQLSTLNSAAQALATFIISHGYFDGVNKNIEINPENGHIQNISVSKIIRDLKLLEKAIFMGRVFSLKNQDNSKLFFYFLSRIVNKITNFIDRFN